MTSNIIGNALSPATKTTPNTAVPGQQEQNKPSNQLSSQHLTATDPLLDQNSYGLSSSLDITFDALLEEVSKQIDHEYEDSDGDPNGILEKNIPIFSSQESEH